MKRLLNYFLQGVVFVAPIAVTIYVCRAIFLTIDGWLGLPIPGAGFVATILLITLFGLFASKVLARSVLGRFERLLNRLPFVRLLYSSTKDLLNAFVGERRSFDRPVLVTLSATGHAKAIGFITQESLAGLGLTGHVAVYFPQSYNFAGYLLVFPSEHVRPIEAASADVLAFVISGGVTGIAHGARGSPNVVRE